MRTVRQVDDDYVIVDDSDKRRHQGCSRVRIRYITESEPYDQAITLPRNEKLNATVSQSVHLKKDYVYEQEDETSILTKQTVRQREQMLPPFSRTNRSTGKADMISARSELLSDDEEYRVRGRNAVPQRVYKYVNACRKEIGFEVGSEDEYDKDRILSARNASTYYMGAGIKPKETHDIYKGNLAKQDCEQSGHYEIHRPSAKGFHFRSEGLNPGKNGEKVIITERRIYRPKVNLSGAMKETAEDRLQYNNSERSVRLETPREKALPEDYVEYGEKYVKKGRSMSSSTD